MVKNRTHSIDFKRQVAQDYLAGETLHGLAKRHDLSRNLIRIWVRKYEAGALDEARWALSEPGPRHALGVVEWPEPSPRAGSSALAPTAPRSTRSAGRCRCRRPTAR